MKETVDGANNNRRFKLSSPTTQDFVNWVHRWYVFLQESKVMIQRSFEVCDITTTNPKLFWNDYFFKRTMANVVVDSDWTDDDMFKDGYEN